MSKIFIAYQFRGENERKVENWLNIIKDEVIRGRNDYFCSFCLKMSFKEKAILLNKCIVFA